MSYYRQCFLKFFLVDNGLMFYSKRICGEVITFFDYNFLISTLFERLETILFVFSQQILFKLILESSLSCNLLDQVMNDVTTFMLILILFVWSLCS